MSDRTLFLNKPSDGGPIRKSELVRSSKRAQTAALAVAENPHVEKYLMSSENQVFYKENPMRPDFGKPPAACGCRDKTIGGMKNRKIPKPSKLTFNQKMQIARLPLEYLRALALYIPLFIVLLAT